MLKQIVTNNRYIFWLVNLGEPNIVLVRYNKTTYLRAFN